MALNVSDILCPLEPLLQYPCVRAELKLENPYTRLIPGKERGLFSEVIPKEP